jgi:predicted nuclease of predicted toxin-antitoxin system
MRLLIDAQLPRDLALHLSIFGHDVKHTLDLPGGNRTSDSTICAIADHDDRVVVSKDADFVISHLIGATPRRLLVVATGNIANAELRDLFSANIHLIEQAFANATFVELSRTRLLIHH